MSMLNEFVHEKEKIIKSIEGMTLSDIYEEKQAEMQRLDEIHEEINNLKHKTHSN